MSIASNSTPRTIKLIASNFTREKIGGLPASSVRYTVAGGPAKIYTWPAANEKDCGRLITACVSDNRLRLIGYSKAAKIVLSRGIEFVENRTAIAVQELVTGS